jgi:Protein of unknown function (DUF1572).
MLGKRYLADGNKRFHDLKRLGDNALEQVSDADFFRVLDAESNSIAILLKHVAGNMKSRWSDLFVSDGEKSDRERWQNLSVPRGASAKHNDEVRRRAEEC